MRNWSADPRPGCGISYVSQISAIDADVELVEREDALLRGRIGREGAGDAKASVGVAAGRASA